MQISEQQLKEKISLFIEQNTQNFVQDLETIISYKSVSSDKAEANAPFGAEVAATLNKTLQLAHGMGIETQNLDGFIGWAELAGTQKEYLAAITHLDVVPEGEGWNSPPYTLLQKDGWLIGRGVEDDKGPSVLLLYVAKFFKELALPLRYTMRFLFGTNEETGMLDVAHYLEKQPQPLFCFTPDADFPLSYGEKGVFSGDFVSEKLDGNIREFSAGLASNVIPDRATCLVKADVAKLENTENIIVSEEDGCVRINANGIGGHAAHPEGTLNAIGLVVEYLLDNKLCNSEEQDFLLLLQKLHTSSDGAGIGIAAEDDIFGKLTCIGGTISLQEHRLVQNINSRLPTSITTDVAREKLTETASQHGSSFKVHSADNAFHVDPASPEMLVLINTYNEITGEDAKPFTMGGGTYARHFKNAAAFGPNFPATKKPDFVGMIHGANEGFCLQDAMKALEIYILALWRLQQLEF